MKKSLIVLGIAVLATLSFSSCKKDYTCECTFTNGTPTVKAEILDSKKADAEDACTSVETTYKITDAGAACTLK